MTLIWYNKEKYNIYYQCQDLPIHVQGIKLYFITIFMFWIADNLSLILTGKNFHTNDVTCFQFFL
jgi:hypothetical protein